MALCHSRRLEVVYVLIFVKEESVDARYFVAEYHRTKDDHKMRLEMGEACVIMMHAVWYAACNLPITPILSVSTK